MGNVGERTALIKCMGYLRIPEVNWKEKVNKSS